MMEETPTKVVSLLGVALTSLAFLFMVSATNASFSGTLSQVSDPFAPEKVVSAVDKVAAAYSNFVAANLLQPASKDLALAVDTVAWTLDNAQDGAIAMLGIEANTESTVTAQVEEVGQVAGARTGSYARQQRQQPGLLDVIYSVLIR